jgi:hypothetical protein
MLFGGLLAAALILVLPYHELILVSWLVCTLGIVAARLVGSFLAQPENLVSRALLETMVRPSIPLASCLAASIRLPNDQAHIFAVSTVVFFSIMLLIDRILFVANLPSNKSLLT